MPIVYRQVTPARVATQVTPPMYNAAGGALVNVGSGGVLESLRWAELWEQHKIPIVAGGAALAFIGYKLLKGSKKGRRRRK